MRRMEIEMTWRSVIAGVRLSMLIIAMSAFSAFAASAAEATASNAQPAREHGVKRKILALFDSAQDKDVANTRIHKLAEMPLNHIGYDLRYWDVARGFPTLDQFADYRGVITWFGGALANDIDYLTWADKAASQGLRFVVLGDLGARVSEETVPLINRFLAHLGLELGSNFITETYGTTVLKVDSSIVGFERPFFAVIPPYSIIKLLDKGAVAHIMLRAPAHAGSDETVLAVHNDGGGFVHSGFISIYDVEKSRDRWVIDPFAYFRLAFGGEVFPIPDVTTVSGRRIYFSHVDGDGWLNVSLIEGYREKGTLASEVMLKDLIEPYPDLPVTIGVVTGDFDASLGGDPAAGEIARRMFALQQVEIGSHTHTHPFVWSFYEHYDRKDELKQLNEAGEPSAGGVFGRLGNIVGGITPREQFKTYIASSSESPRAYMARQFDIEEDIAHSLQIAESYAPAGKKAMLMQWSGDARPFEQAVRASRKAGVRNLNGGDPRYDIEWPSVSYLPPISRMIGSERQIYAAASNENTFTNNWTGPFYGFQSLTETLKNTELPRRLKPFNLYYHTYSAEREASRGAVIKHLEEARRGPYAPIPASDYAAIADSYFEVEIAALGNDKWVIRNRKELQTLRFDDAAGMRIDWQQSHGVLGAAQHGGALYVALDAAVEEPLIAIKRNAKAEKLQRAILHDSRWRIDSLAQDGCSLAFNARGFGDGEMNWQGMTPGAYSLQVERGDQMLWHDAANVGDDGELRVVVRASALEPLRIRVTCRSDTTASLVGKGIKP